MKHVDLLPEEVKEGAVEHILFDSTEERNKYIDENFPERKMDPNIPGVFYVSGDRVIQVFLDDLWVSTT